MSLIIINHTKSEQVGPEISASSKNALKLKKCDIHEIKY